MQKEILMRQHQNILARTLRRTLAILVGANGLMLALSGTAAANCSGTSATVPVRLPATITVPIDAKVGSRLIQWAEGPEPTNYFRCSGYHSIGMGAHSPGMIDSGVKLSIYGNGVDPMVPVWKTNVPGVGIAIIVKTFLGACRWGSYGGSKNTSEIQFTGSCGQSTNVDLGARIGATLVKIGDITPGVINPMTVAYLGPVGVPTPAHMYRPISSHRIRFVTAPVTIVAQTCQIMTPNMSVNLTPNGGVPSSAFTGPNTTSPPVPFSLRLNCSSNLARLAVTFTDIRNPNNRSNILPLSDESSASGLGVQILHENTPVNFGQDSRDPANPGRIALRQVTGSEKLINLPFTGRYIQTGETATPGSANANASFTFSYQ
jgi:major type 1 subunit fimbrin (pilin)